MKHFLEYVVRSLVDNPDDVQISEVVGEKETGYRVSLHPPMSDSSSARGRTISAIRSLINAANKAGNHLAVEVVENS